MKAYKIILSFLLFAALWGFPSKATAQIFAVRVNALGWTTGTLNAGVEIAVSDQWSVDLSGYWESDRHAETVAELRDRAGRRALLVL